MSDNNEIKGAGGGGKGGGSARVAVEAPDSLRSMQLARVLDLICEGPIYGLVDGFKSVFINETPLQNSDGTMNFKNVAIQWRNGHQIQAPFNDIDGIEAETPVSVVVKQATPVVRTITTTEADLVRVTVSIPQLSNQNLQNGDLNGSYVSFRIEVQNGGSGFQVRISDTIEGKTTSKYQRSYLIPFNGPGPWDVRVVRETPDSTAVAIQNEIWWESYTTIVRAKLTYPNSASVLTMIDSSQFNAIPTRGYGMRGLIIKVPSNYDPIMRSYTGAWDGTFKLAWTDNPAWCFYDLLTNERYGLGGYVDQNAIDKWTLYSIGQYCDQIVPNGYGGYEARFRCNMYLQTREEAYQVVQNFASIFRGITYWGAGTIVTLQDRPSDAVALYTHANVIDGRFTYSGSSIKQRHTVALVAWSDPKDFYRQKIEYVQDEEMVKKYGIIETSITAFGCTSRGQAHRYGKWILAVERYCTETVSFKAGLDSAGLYPGAIIKTSDSIRSGPRMGGRIRSHTQNTIALDAEFNFEPGRQYKIHVVSEDTVPRTFTVTGGAGKREVVTVAEAITVPIVENAVFIIAADNLVPETWRVIGVKDAGKGLIEVVALAYNESIYDYVELDSKFVLPPVSNIKVRPARPQNLRLVSYAYKVGGVTVGLNGTLSWTSDATRFHIRWRRANGTWNEFTAYTTSVEITGLTNDPHVFQVIAIGTNSLESDVAAIEVTPSLEMVSLPTPTGLSLEGPFTIDQAKFKWDPVSGASRYEVEIHSLGVLRRFLDVGSALTYTYSASDMRVDGGPWRVIKVRVRARGPYGARSEWAELEVGNSQIGPLQGINVESGIRSIFFQCERPSDPDFVGIMIWVGEDPNFLPDATNLVYDGPDTIKVVYQQGDGAQLIGAKTYYIRAAGYDNFGKDSLIISNSILVMPHKNAPDADTIQQEMIQNGAISIAKFAQGIEPVMLVDSLTDMSTYLGATNVFDKNLRKLFKWDGEKYEHRIGAGDLMADTVTAGTVAAGAINAREIAAGAITSEKLYVAARGAALNADPSMKDSSAWEPNDDVTFLQISDGAAGLYAVQSNSGAQTTLVSRDILSIDPRKRYCLRITVRRSSNANGLLMPGVEVLDGNNQRIPNESSQYWYYGQNTQSVGTAWQQIVEQINVPGTGSFPASAKSMRLIADINQNGSDGYFQIQDFRLEEILPGVLIQDGSISSSKIQTGAITTDKLLANSITSEKINALAITSDKIAAQAVTANHLAAGAITAGAIAAGSITADKIDSRNLTIKDAAGNIILGSGVNLNVARITGLGNFAYLNAITAANISSYIASAAIGSAYIQNLSVTSAHIQDLVVGTQKITPGAVTGNLGAVGRLAASVVLTSSGSNICVFAKGKVYNPDGGVGDEYAGVAIYRDNLLLSVETVGSYTGYTSASTFTIDQIPAGSTSTYTAAVATNTNGGRNGEYSSQILVLEFKR